jgi:hypothetical protein
MVTVGAMTEPSRLAGPADVIVRLRARGLNPAGVQRIVFSGSVEGSPMVGSVTWNTEHAVVLITTGAPVKLTASNRQALIDAVAEINATLAVLGLVVRDTGVYFTAHVYVDVDGTISGHAFEKTLDLVIAGTTQHRARLLAAANAQAGS